MIQMELGDTATAYVPYSPPTECDISFPTSAGTVYGGTLNVTTGELTVDKAVVTLDGSADWAEYTAGSGDGKYVVNNVIRGNAIGDGSQYAANLYPFAGSGSSSATQIVTDKRVYVQSSFQRVWVYDSAYTTLNALKEALNATPLQVLYPLSTPITYHCTPTEVRTLLGSNAIFADTGDVTVEYAADTKTYIDDQIAALVATLSTL